MGDISRSYILDKMKGRTMRIEDFDYERLSAPPLYSLLSVDDVNQLHKLATSIRYAARPLERMQAIDQIMVNRGFRKFAGGTNRAVYKFLEDDSFVVKVATDAVGVQDSPREYVNQFHIKPFCCKVFEVSPCGTVGLFERVKPITSREEFLSVADQVYLLISQWLTGEYVMDDIGSHYFMNYGYRNGFGCVILDYTFSYKLDGNKLYCNTTLDDGSLCGGVIDYDEGYNHLYCTKCGKRYRAQELSESIKTDKVIIKGGKTKMKVAFGYGDDVRVVNDPKDYDVKPKLVPRKKGKKSKIGTLKVSINGGDPIDVEEYNKPEEEHVEIKAKVTRGTIAHAKEIVEEEPKLVEERVEVDYTMDGPKVSVSNKSVDIMVPDLVHRVNAEVVCSADIDGVEEGKTKWLLLSEKVPGVQVHPGYQNLVVDTIMGRPVAEIKMITNEAYKELVDTVTDIKAANKELSETIGNISDDNVDLNNENHDILETNKQLQSMIGEYESDISGLREKIKELEKTCQDDVVAYDKLASDYNDLVDEFNELEGKYQALLKSFNKETAYEPDDKNPESEAEEVEEVVEEEPQFNVGSPLLSNAEEEDDSDYFDDDGDTLPPGAVPPVTNKNYNG